ncbi:MAG: hypothetical protein KDN20_10175 [Verrucomicrobiae bacterium]|nr:hypothetical protein [Verrucomicrobiae bacterium]
MSVEPKSSDTLSQLKELMMGDERRELDDLRARLENLDEESVDRLALDLAPALRRRREMGEAEFDELVAALQAGTESAIQRSVSQDKAKLSKALFPIMGPAIRNYVMDLFRGMVEELNETIRNTTSAERLKWRAQARMAGKSYSEYVLLKTRSFRVEEVYLMQRDTGLLLLHAARNPEEEADGEADLVSGMFTAIRSFVRDSFASEDAGDDDASELDSFSFGEREVIIEAGPSMVIAAVAHGVPPASARDELKGILEDLHAEMADRLDHFSGDMTLLESSRPTLRRALIENRTTAEETEKGGGLWRAWLALGIIGAVAAVIAFFGMREQSRWNRFEAAVRSEPGVAVTSVENDGWWRHRTMRGLRDPLAVDPASRLAEFGIDAEKASFDFAPMVSMAPEFVAMREAKEVEGQKQILAALGALRSDLGKTLTPDDLVTLGGQIDENLNALRSETQAAETRRAQMEAESLKMREAMILSQFGAIDGLEISFSEDGSEARFSGALEAEDFEKVQAQVKPLAALMKVDTSGLNDDSGARMTQLLSEIGAVSVLFQDGSLNQDDNDRVVEMVGMLRQLDSLAAKVGRRFRFEVVAHPLIGANREANRVVEKNRAEQIRDRLLEAGFAEDRISMSLSEDPNRAGDGVSLKALAGQGGEEAPER